jgi:pimeloyl-ACP methyl ester carboxylesterase
MNEMVMHKAMKRTALDQPAAAAAARPALVIHAPGRRGAIGAVGLPSARKFPADRAGRPVKQPADRLLTAAATMLGKDHATFLAAEVLASSVHRNILRPVGHGCCTSNLSLSSIYASFPGPLLIAHGSGDRIVPIAPAQAMAAARNGPTTTLWTGANHQGSHPEDPDA